MTMHESLVSSMQLPEETLQRIRERGVVMADEDTMSRAIHDVYCGIMADHEHPNEKDHEQARAVLAALQKHASS